jgi:hypothetical protein
MNIQEMVRWLYFWLCDEEEAEGSQYVYMEGCADSECT